MHPWTAGLYAIFAAGLVVQLGRAGRRTWDQRLTLTDRALVSASGFFLGVPLCVGLAYGVQLWLVGRWQLALERSEFGFFWSSLSFAELSSSFTAGRIAVLLAGPLVALALAALLVASTVRWPKQSALNLLRLEIGRSLVGLSWGLYPAASLLLRRGDAWALRQELRRFHPLAGDLLPLLVLALILSAWALWRRHLRAGFVWYTSPLFDRLQRARQRLRRNPEDSKAKRDMARVLLALGKAERALACLPAAETVREQVELHFLRGIAFFQQQQPRNAAHELCSAGSLLEENAELQQESEALMFEITLALAAARLALADVEGSLQAAEVALLLRPADSRLLLIHADALVEAGRQDEARHRLQRGLQRANASLALEIHQRLRAMGQSPS